MFRCDFVRAIILVVGQNRGIGDLNRRISGCDNDDDKFKIDYRGIYIG